MDTSALQSIIALPIFLAGMGCLVYGLVRPASIGLLRLSLFAYALQFCMGPAKGILPFQSSAPAESADVILAFMAIYFFWIGALLVGFLWRNQFDTVVLHSGDEVIEGRGVFAQMADVSLRASPSTLLMVYGCIMATRIGVGVIYGVGLSGMATLERMTSMPYPVVVLNGLIGGFGSAFVFVSVARLAFKQPGAGVSWFILIAEALFTFTQGRRPMLIICVFAMFALVLKTRRVQLKHALGGGVIFLLLWQFVFPFFVSMRDQWQEAGGLQVYMIREAWLKVVGDTVASARKRDEYETGVNERLNAIVLNYTVANRLNNGVRPVNGLFVQNAALAVIPRIVYGAKLEHVGEPDSLLNQVMSIPGQDQVSNLPVFALADFGAIGGLLYGAIFGCGVRFIGFLMRILLSRSPLGSTCVLSMACSGAVLQMEIHLDGFLGIIRNIIVAFFLIFFLSMIIGRKHDEAAAAPVPA